MAVSLTKGQNISLDSRATQLAVALTWEPRVGLGEEYDLDAVCFLLNENQQARNDSDFIYWNNLTSPCGSILHHGDDLKGRIGEQIDVDLARVPGDIYTILFAVAIYNAKIRKQNFGIVRNAGINLVNRQNSELIASFDLSEDADVADVVLFGELYKPKTTFQRNNTWKFRALGQSYLGGLERLVHTFGLETVK